MPARLRRLEPGELAAAQERHDLRALTKHYLAVLGQRAPGKSVEVRVPPYAAIQCVPGVRHTRGTPPAVVEMDAETWIGLATGEIAWSDARISASGERADLTEFLPLTGPA